MTKPHILSHALQSDSDSESSSSDEEIVKVVWKLGDNAVYTKHGRSQDVTILKIKKKTGKLTLKTIDGTELSSTKARLTIAVHPTKIVGTTAAEAKKGGSKKKSGDDTADLMDLLDM